MITIENLSKRFGAIAAVSGVSLQAPTGAFLVLVGPSGCGKSTMLRMLAGLELPSEGTIAFDGTVVSDGGRGWTIALHHRNAGLVFQSYALWPHMTVGGNVEWPLKVAGLARPERRKRVEEVLSLLGIAPLAARYPSEISGGQQQRVAIARTIAPKPGILLFDEPLSNLDAKLRVEMRAELMRVHRATGATSIYVTHDQVEAMTMATHIAVMNNGRVEQFGAPRELLSRPATAFVATFVGTPPANLVPVADAIQAGALTQAAGASHAMYRAEDIGLGSSSDAATLTLEFTEASNVAGRIMVTGSSGGLRLTAIVDAAPDYRIGDRVTFRLPDKPTALFADGRRLA